MLPGLLQAMAVGSSRLWLLFSPLRVQRSQKDLPRLLHLALYTVAGRGAWHAQRETWQEMYVMKVAQGSVVTTVTVFSEVSVAVELVPMGPAHSSLQSCPYARIWLSRKSPAASLLSAQGPNLWTSSGSLDLPWLSLASLFQLMTGWEDWASAVTFPHHPAFQIAFQGTSLVVQWPRLCTSNAGGLNSI